MTGPEIIKCVDTAIVEFRREPRPLQWNASERSFAHRLAVHMEGLFSGWDIDCDYNKDGSIVKQLEGIKGCKAQKKSDKIMPDIIVHKRNGSWHDANLLMVELKLNDECDVCDKRKLELFTRTGQFQYRLGLYINIDSGRFKRTWYQGGIQVGEKDVV